MENKKIIFSFIILFIGIVLGIGIFYLININKECPVNKECTNIPSTVVSGDESSSKSVSASGSVIKQFNSYEELKNFLKKGTTTTSTSNSMGGAGRALMSESMGVNSADAGGGGGAPATRYSKTNVQVEGVDEPDMMKNDGKYIYTLSGNKIKIVEAYPADSMKIFGELDFGNPITDYSKPYTVRYAKNIFINDNKLIVFLTGHSYVPYNSIRCLGLSYCGGNYDSFSDIYVYDAADKANLKLEQNISLNGDYFDARMIKDYVYLLSRQNVNPDEPDLPICYINGVYRETSLNHIYYFDYEDQSYYMTSVSALNVKTGEFNSEAYLTGYSSELYASENNIYITTMEYMKSDDYQKRLINEAVVPLVPESEKQKIQEILDSKKYEYSKWKKIGLIVENYYNTLQEIEKESFNSTLNSNLMNTKIRLEKERTKTVVHKISVDNSNIEYKKSGKVPGRILNQFSMDESEGNFRIATTTGQNWWGWWDWNSGNINSTNGVYVLDNEMNLIGSVDNLASGETIYSTRFIGKRAYLVTYRRVDPLFVIDLSGPTNPQMLGYLKVNGVSDYLHPYDENHIIGFGTDATDEGRMKGMKITLFDVTDAANPKVDANYYIGDRGTTSPILRDHKALMFDKETGLMAIPVLLSEINPAKYQGEIERTGKIPDWAHGEQTWQGAYVFEIDASGIRLKGKITHFKPYVPNFGPASNEPTGAMRGDLYGYAYRKIGPNSWIRTYESYYYYTYTDAKVDELPGGINYKPNFYDQRYTIRRSLFMDNVLYTVSNSQVKANDLNNDLKDMSSIDLGYIDNYNYYNWYY